MKKGMKKGMKKHLGIIVAMLLCVICACSMNCAKSSAASKLTKKQRQTYQKIVKEYVSEAEEQGGRSEAVIFCIDDINADGKKELIISNYSSAASADWFTSIYNVKGEIVKTSGGHEFDHDYGLLGVSKYKKGIICCGERYAIGSGETYYKAQKNGTFKAIAHYDCSRMNEKGEQIDYCEINGKKVSYSTYAKKVKAYGKPIEMKAYEATGTNIQKKIK